MVVEHKCARLTVALGNRIDAKYQAVLQTHLRWLHFNWGLVRHSGKTTEHLGFVHCPISAAFRA